MTTVHVTVSTFNARSGFVRARALAHCVERGTLWEIETEVPLDRQGNSARVVAVAALSAVLDELRD